MQNHVDTVQLGVKIPSTTYPALAQWCDRHYMSVADALRQGLYMLMDSDPTLSRAEAANAAIIADPPFRPYRRRVPLICPPDRAVSRETPSP